MKSVFQYFVENYKLVFLTSLFLVILGVMGATLVKRESRPPVDFASASIVTIYPGSSPEEVEEGVTDKIEDELRSVEGIKDISSTSQSGQSKIMIRVDMDNYDSQKVLDDIQRALQRVSQLPDDLKDPPRFSHFNAKEIPVLRLALIGSNDKRKRDRLVKDLESLLEDEKGVSSIKFGGFSEREFQILLDSQKMNRFHVGITEVVNSVRKKAQNIPAGYLKTPGDQRLVRVTGKIENIDELANIPIRSNFSGQTIYIKDIAQVRDHMEDPSILVRINGKSATTITVTKTAEADTIKSFRRIKKKLDQFVKNLKEDYSVIIYNNESERIYKRLKIVNDNALFGLLLVLIILFIFLPGSLGLAAAVSLPLSVLGTFGLMPLLGVNINNITLLAFVIALGMLVDNAVVISENYARLRFEGMNRPDAAVKAAHQFWLPITATMATTVVAFLPMLVTTGVMGQFIMWIPIMVSIALSVSLFESFFLLPARLQFTIKSLSRYKKKGKDSSTNSTWFDRWRDRFERMMGFCVRHRYFVTFGIFLLMVSAGVVAVKGNRFELFPSEYTEYYFATYEMPIKTTLEQTDGAAGQLSDKIIEVLGRNVVKYVIANTGQSQINFRDSQAKTGHYVGMLTLAIPLDVAQQVDTQDILKKLRAIPREPFTSLTFKEARGGPPVGTPLNITFRSRNYEVLRKLIDKVRSKVETIPGVVDIQDDQISGGKEYRIIPKGDTLARLKLDTQTVGLALRTALQGSIVNELSQEGESFKLRIRYGDSDRTTLESLKRTKIMEPSRQLITLNNLVKIVPQEGPRVRKHYNFKRSISLTAGVVPELITSVKLNKVVKDYIDEIITDYSGVSITYGGEQESTRESTNSLKTAMVIAIFGIFGILVFLFGKFLQPILIISCIPLGLIGVSWAFFLHQRPLSFLALIGVVGLAGVVVNSAIVLVSYINELRLQNSDMNVFDVVAKASAHRLRAVMVTSLTTVGGLFPTAYGIGGYDSALAPMTLALAWGLVSGTLLTLIWVPCGYAILEDLSRLIHKIIHKLIPGWSSFFPEKPSQ